MSTYTAWVPDSSITDGKLTRHFEALIEEYLQTDLGLDISPQIGIKNLNHKIPSAPDDAQERFLPELGIVLRGSYSTDDTSMSKFLGFDTPSAWKSKADEAFTTRLNERLFQSIAAFLVKILSDKDVGGNNWMPGQRFAVQPRMTSLKLSFSETDQTVEVFAPRHLFSSLRCRLIEGTPPQGEALFPIERAIAQQTINLGAKLGKTTLTLAEFKELSVNDTIVFDVHAESALPGIIDDHVETTLGFDVYAGEDSLSLKVRNTSQPSSIE